ncbi:MAG TPA: UDP-glucose/GDP-mannose dehydrogenase family protein [Candidatus Cybelea sp.]|nr:UDP-glucose/GDP-mannose dehydrogenase family protein [Candidatus Cybelea sp.]
MRSFHRIKITILGTGFVGTANAVGFAELGFDVVGFDTDVRRIEQLNAGLPPYREAGLSELLERHLESGRLTFVNDLSLAVAHANFIIVAVGTPSRDDGSADLSALHIATDALSRTIERRSTIVVLRSTVPPGTSDRMAQRLPSGVELLYCPEFLREGSAVYDFLNPDRSIVGAESQGAATAYSALVEGLVAPVIVTSRSDAELIKGGANAFLALKISFANEIANICGRLNADSHEVLRGIGSDRRIGDAYLKPGIGFGGPCFEKDVLSLEHVARGSGSPSHLLQATLRVNAAQPRKIVDVLEEELGVLRDMQIGVWGLAFKAGTDDVRSSLALRVLEDLVERGATVIAYDPAIIRADLPHGTTLVGSAMEAARADALLVLTEWPEFCGIDPNDIARAVRRRIVVDGRNVLDGPALANCGIRYRGVGRSSLPEYAEYVNVSARPA